jgi:hypothetical protein
MVVSGGTETPPGVLLGQAAQLAAEHSAVVLEESFQGFPFSGDSDKVLFVCRGRRICHRKRLQARLDRADMRGITRAAHPPAGRSLSLGSRFASQQLAAAEASTGLAAASA